MALVVLLKGVNVGGRRTFRPSALARQLSEFEMISIGAAGTFVVPKPVERVKLRTEIQRRLPFEAVVTICRGNDVLRLASTDPFAGYPSRPDIVKYVSFMAKKPGPLPPLPLVLPEHGGWGLRVLECQNRFILGLYRRQMKAIGYLGQLERIFGVPLTTRNWNTILAISRVLRG